MKRVASIDDEDYEARLEKIKQGYINKQHTLILCNRGVNSRYRHLAKDMHLLMPHAKTDVKVDDRKDLSVLNEMADLKNCTNILYFEGRKHNDMYLWVARTPSGPSVKFHVTNVHTLGELKFTGNCLKGSRPIISFDKTFDNPEYPHFMLLKELFSQAFGTPKMHPKSKPFIDHVIMFSIFGGRIWYRNFQIVDEYFPDNPKQLKEEKTLVEIGPRFVMNIQSIYAGSFTGELLYTNPKFVSPAMQRRTALASLKSKTTYTEKAEQKKAKQKQKQLWAPTRDVTDDVF